MAAINDGFGFCFGKVRKQLQEIDSRWVIEEGEGFIKQDELAVLGEASGKHNFLFYAIAECAEGSVL